MYFECHGDSKTRRGIHFTVKLYYTKIAVLGAGRPQWMPRRVLESP